MTLAGIELRYLVNDINKKIDGYYVSNIYGITKDSLLFKFHHPEKSDVLLMLSTFGIWITKVKIDPIEPNKLLKHLRNNLLRFKDFSDLISGISQTELTKQLKELESSGIVVRKVFAEVPVRVEYSLTEIGVSLLDPIKSLYEWAVKYGDEIKRNRQS